jgi:hypothetical protein
MPDIKHACMVAVNSQTLNLSHILAYFGRAQLMHKNSFSITGFKPLGRIIEGVWFIVVYPSYRYSKTPHSAICHARGHLYDGQIK